MPWHMCGGQEVVLFPPCGNTGRQPWQQAPLSADPSYQPPPPPATYCLSRPLFPDSRCRPQALCYCPSLLPVCTPNYSQRQQHCPSTHLTEMQTFSQYPNNYRSNSAGHKVIYIHIPVQEVLLTLLPSQTRAPVPLQRLLQPAEQQKDATTLLCFPDEGPEGNRRVKRLSQPLQRTRVTPLGPGPPATSWALLTATQPLLQQTSHSNDAQKVQ